MPQSSGLTPWVSLVPGKKIFGTYHFLPCFFVLGGVLEWIMLKVRISHKTFYDVYRRNRSQQCQQKLEALSTNENCLTSK